MILGHEYNLKTAFGRHSRELSFSLTDRQRMLCVIPVKRDRGIRSLFVIVAIAFIFVEREISVGTAKDAQLDSIFSLFRGPFFLRPHRNNGTRAHEQRKLIDRSRRFDGVWTLYGTTSPEVIPFRLGQINAPRTHAGI